MISSNANLLQLLKILWGHISLRRQYQAGLLLLLMVLAALSEILSIGAVIPFLGVLTNPQYIFDNNLFRPLINLPIVKNTSDILLLFTVVFCLAAILSGALRLVLSWVNNRLAFLIGADLSLDVYRKILYQNYEFHVKHNSSEIIAVVSTKANAVIFQTIFPVLNALASMFILVVIILALLIINPQIAIVTAIGFGGIYVLIVRLTKKRVHQNSIAIAQQSTQVLKSLQEGLGGIRDVLVDGNQDVYCDIYKRANLLLLKAYGDNQFIAGSPRFLIESVGMVLIASLAFGISQDGKGMGNAIPMLGAFALSAQRLLPVLQQLYVSWSNIKGGQKILEDVLNMLSMQADIASSGGRTRKLQFFNSIKLHDVSFRYFKSALPVLKGVNLEIKKGSKVGFIGSTGGGKSTLLDIVMALLTPERGLLKVDDIEINHTNYRQWQAAIAHVPQAIYLSDSTIAENIAFGVPKAQIDYGRLKIAAQQAQIDSAIESWTDGYDTVVGERGIRLSGGQRQRIGIARALYKKADVIIFDEATSALDEETERLVMQAINSLDENLTILIIAHRFTTLKECEKIIEITSGVVSRVGSYSEIIG
jgi:ATP-binding cassette subfamily B protein